MAFLRYVSYSELSNWLLARTTCCIHSSDTASRQNVFAYESSKYLVGRTYQKINFQNLFVIQFRKPYVLPQTLQTFFEVSVLESGLVG